MMFAVWVLLLAQSPSFEAALRTGLEALEHNDLAGARVALESAEKLRPDRPEVWLALAQTYWKLHDSKLAGSAAEKAEHLAPGDPIVLKALSLFYSESGNFEKAAECAAGYASKTHADPSAYARAIQLYLQAGKPRPAIESGAKRVGRREPRRFAVSARKGLRDGRPADGIGSRDACGYPAESVRRVLLFRASARSAETQQPAGGDPRSRRRQESFCPECADRADAGCSLLQHAAVSGRGGGFPTRHPHRPGSGTALHFFRPHAGADRGQVARCHGGVCGASQGESGELHSRFPVRKGSGIRREAGRS